MITCLNFASDISTHCPCILWLGRCANKSKDKIIIKNKNVCFWPHLQFTSLFSFCDLFLWLVPPVTPPHGTQVFEQIVEANEDKTSPMYFSLCGWFELLLSWNTWTLFKIYFWLHLITVVKYFHLLSFVLHVQAWKCYSDVFTEWFVDPIKISSCLWNEIWPIWSCFLQLSLIILSDIALWVWFFFTIIFQPKSIGLIV